MNTQTPEKQENLFLSLLINIIVPVLILTYLSTPERLGAVYALILALAFPLTYGLIDLWQRRTFNLFSILGLISILLTGGIGLLELDPQWVAVKEAAIPFTIGAAILISIKTPYPLVKLLFYNDKLIDIPKVESALLQTGQQVAFEKRLRQASYLLAGSFFLSSLLNYLLARWIVVSPAGTPEFNAELGKMMALSYPVIVIPSMVIFIFAVWFLVSGIKKLTQLAWEDIFLHLEK